VKLKLLGAAYSALISFAPADAATLVTTGTTFSCGSDCAFNNSVALTPFNPSLGTLEAITLEIAARSTNDYSVVNTTGSTQTVNFAYQGSLQTSVAGLNFVIPVSGLDQRSFASSEVRLSGGTFTATGSGLFTIASADFANFLAAPNCGFGNGPFGVCASTPFFGVSPSFTVNNIVASNPGGVSVFAGIGTSVITTTNFALTYSFSAVPEPATWAMMLIGFGAVGSAMRRRGSHTAGRLAATA
jgi:hypothetical protein